MLPIRIKHKMVALHAEGVGPTQITRLLPAVTFRQVQGYLYRPEIKAKVAAKRKELVALADDAHILNRQEIRRLLSMTALEGLADKSDLVAIPDALKAVSELNKMDGHYTPEQGQDRLETGRALAHKVMLSDPAFAEFLRDEAAVINARSGRVVEIQEAAAEVATRTLSPAEIAERDRLAKEEDEAMALILGDADPDFDGGYVPEGSSKRELTINLHR